MKKRILSIIMTFTLLIGVLPTTAFANQTDWANQAVTTLNDIYGSDIFSEDETTPMKESDVYTILQSMRCSSDKITNNSETDLTRSKACEVLADVFNLPLGEKTAITYLFEKNIINGKSSGELDENGTVTKAQFAVLTYRVLNSVGGGKGSNVDTLKPATDEYFAWMYLAARKCVTFNTEDSSGNMDSQTWSGWVDGLKALPKENPMTSFNPQYPYEGQTVTKLEAAVKIVDEYINTGGSETIFSDVQTNASWYDGVMYLFDRQIITGNGDGTFAPDAQTPRYQFAVLLYRYKGSPDLGEQNQLEAAKMYVTSNGYMTPPTENAETWWNETVTREEAIVGIMKACGVNVNNVNTTILDRFTNNTITSTIQDADKYIAYAVIIGLVNGTADGSLDLNLGVTRGVAGVLLYRTLIGVDTTKMQDYRENIENVKTPAQAVGTLSVAPLVENTITLTLREDWRLTSDLDLAIPEGTTLEINGQNKYHIYEMGGTLQNSGLGAVNFTNSTILYPYGQSETCNTETSNNLMSERQAHKIIIDSNITNGTISADKEIARKGEQVNLTITPNEGYVLKNLAITDSGNSTVTVNNKTFSMPASDVTINAEFIEASSATPLTLTVDKTSLTGGGTVILTASGTSNTIYVICDDTSITLTNNNDGTWTASLPNVTKTYTFTASANGCTDAKCIVNVTYKNIDSGSSGGSSSGGSSSSGNKTETTTNPDGSTTTTVTKPDGSKTETTKYPDGSQEVIQTDKEGTVTTTTTDTNGNKTEVIENTDGSSVITVTNKDGSGSKTTVDTNGKVEIEAIITENSTALPVKPVDKTSNNTITVNMPDGASKVEIPVKNADNNTVVVLVKADGTEEIIKTSVTTENGVSVTLNDGDTIKIIDNSKDFADVTSDFWGANAVDFVTSREIFNGTSETDFSPNTAMNRAMIVTVLARLEGVDTSTGANWYEVGQNWAIENGISDGSNMNENLTREQLAVMLYRYLGSPATSGDISNFTDSESVSSWAIYAMIWAVENGLISGMGDGTLNPQGEATRAQVATILYRFISNYN